MPEYVWYAGYGSNLSRERFLCYIRGGKPRFGRKIHAGARSTGLPAEDRSLAIKHRLYFALPEPSTATENWGPGGVAFIDPEPDEEATTVCRLWRITREQYEDLKSQEGRVWYAAEVELAEVDGISVMTVTHKQRLRNELPPSAAYLKTIAVGLQETAGMGMEEIAAYFLDKAGIKGRMSRSNIIEVLSALPRERA
jgi:hypothetical protein